MTHSSLTFLSPTSILPSRSVVAPLSLTALPPPLYPTVALTPLASSQSGQQRIAGIGLITTDSSNLSGGLFADVIALVNDRRLGIGVKHHLMRHSEAQSSQ